MGPLPHDLTDLFLAPVVLALEARIDQLAALGRDELALEVAAVSDVGDWTQELRASALLHAVQYLVDCHDWTLAWDPRGIRVEHGVHHLVLGVPVTFTDYLLAAPARGVRGLLL